MTSRFGRVTLVRLQMSRLTDEEIIEAIAARVVERIRPLLTAKVAPRYLSLDQAAEYLSTTTDGVRGMLRAKRFPVRKVGARNLIDIRDIDKALDESIQWLNQDQCGIRDTLPDWL